MKRITVITNLKKDPSLEITKRVVLELSSMAEKIFLDEENKYDAPSNVVFCEKYKLFDEADAVITVGGDGTILAIAPEVSKKGIPVLGINLGRVGFMAELEIEEIPLLSKLFTSEYIVDSRMMLDVDVMRNNEKIHSFVALNDVVVMNGTISKMVELDLFCNGDYVSTYHADGIIMSTPTGSTAYSLSAGGAVIDPALDCILLTPVCAHSFNNSRPIVFSSSSELTVKDVRKSDENTFLTLDGDKNVKISFGDSVLVRRSQYTTDLIKIKSTRFYNALYTKLSERR